MCVCVVEVEKGVWQYLTTQGTGCQVMHILVLRNRPSKSFKVHVKRLNSYISFLHEAKGVTEGKLCVHTFTSFICMVCVCVCVCVCVRVSDKACIGVPFCVGWYVPSIPRARTRVCIALCVGSGVWWRRREAWSRSWAGWCTCVNLRVFEPGGVC